MAKKKKPAPKKPAPKNISRGKPLAFQKPAPKQQAKKAPAKKAAAKKQGPSLTKQENQVFNQEQSDIKKEAHAGPKQLKGLIAQIAEDQYKEDALTGLAHPDAQELKKAGVSEATIAKLAKQYAPEHPAAAAAAPAAAAPGAGTAPTDSPTTPSQYAADVLQDAGLPVTASNEQLLEDQMTVEGMPGGEDNPLATSLKEPGSSTVNSAGVQEYPNLFEGATAEAATLQQGNMSTIYDALKSGTATPQQYAQALANSAYEGYDPAANQQYANSFLADAGQPTTAFSGGGASSGGGSSSGFDSGLQGAASSTLAQAMGTNSFGGLASVIPTLGTQASNSSLQQALEGITSPEAQTLAANTTDAPGSPDQAPGQAQQTAVSPVASYQAQLAALLGNKLQAGTAGKGNG